MTYYCPSTGEICENDRCEEIIDAADNGSGDEVQVECGESWLEVRMRCKECSQLKRLRDLSFAVCIEHWYEPAEDEEVE